MKVKTIALIYETRKDAENTPHNDIQDLYHWREDCEVEAVIHSIEALGFKVIPVGSPYSAVNQVERLKKEIQFVFNISVGFSSRFRLALGPSLYELCGIPYSGADPYGKLLSQNKQLMKSFFDKQGISTPEWTYADRNAVLKELNYPEFPLIVKPAYEGSSIGIERDSVVHSFEELLVKAERVRDELNMPLMIERFIEGRELKAGFIGNHTIESYGLFEDLKESGESLQNDFLYFQAKKEGKYRKVFQDFDDPMYQTLLNDCRKIYDLFLPVDYGTFDIRLDRNGKHYFLEFNADATLHPERTFSKCFEFKGIPYHQVIERILKTSFKRWGIAWN